MDVTYVPNPAAADGHLGTGSNVVLLPETNVKITYVPNPNAADGQGVQIGGGGTGNIFAYDGNPNGNVTATGAGIVIGEGTSEGKLWVKVTAGTTNTDWVLFVT